MRKTVKKLTAVGLTVTSVLGLVACGSSKGTTSQGTSENKEVTKPDTFTVMCDGTVVTETNGAEAFYKQLNEATGLDIKWTRPDHASYYDAVANAFNSDDTMPDVVLLSSDYYALYASNGFLWNMTDAWEHSETKNSGRLISTADNVLSALMVNGEDGTKAMYGLSLYRGNGCCTYVKKAWLDKAGIDASKVKDVQMDFNTYYGYLKQMAQTMGHYVISSPGFIHPEAPNTNYLPEFYQKKRYCGIFSARRQNTRGISMEYIHNLIWLCPLLFIAGFIDSIAGGGGLIALPAYMMCGMPIYYVYGCNKFQCAFGSTVAAWKYFKNGCLDLKITLISAVTSFLCSMLGTRIIFYLKEEQIRSMLMVLLPLTAILVVFMKNAWNYTDTRKSLTVPVALKALLIGMTLGLYDSMYGPGGGTIAMLLFTFLLKYDIRTASGNAKLTLIVSNYTALLSYILSGNVFYMIAIPCAVSNVLGNYIGAGFAIKNGAKIIRPVMICVVTVLIVKIVLGK